MKVKYDLNAGELKVRHKIERMGNGVFVSAFHWIWGANWAKTKCLIAQVLLT